MENNDNDVMEIDLVEVFFVILHWLWLIVVCGAITGILAFCISNFMIHEKYESTTTVYILNRQNESTVTYSDLQTGTQLTKDYAQLIKSRYVLESVIRDLGLNYSYAELLGNVSVTTPTDTRIIAITVMDTDPEKAQYIANAIRDIAAIHIKNVMDIEAVNIADTANLPTTPSSPNVMKWIIVGILLGVVASTAVVVVRYLLDDTIKSSEDIKNYLGLSTLALIPLSEDVASDDSEDEKKTRTGESTATRHHRNNSSSSDNKTANGTSNKKNARKSGGKR